MTSSLRLPTAMTDIVLTALKWIGYIACFAAAAILGTIIGLLFLQ